jgi:hypothetical protein
MSATQTHSTATVEACRADELGQRTLIRHGIADDGAMRRYRAQVRFAQTNPLSPNTAYSQQP